MRPLGWLVLLALGACSATAPSSSSDRGRGERRARDDDARPSLREAAVSATEYELEIVVRRWAWEVTPAGGGPTEPVLRLPDGIPVKVRLTSADASYRLVVDGTELALDVDGDHPLEVALIARTVGTLEGRCVGDCGGIGDDGRAGFVLPIEVVPAAAFAEAAAIAAAGAADAQAPTPTNGARLYDDLGCRPCHAVGGTPKVGPSLDRLAGTTVRFSDGSARTLTVDTVAAYVERSLYDPNALLVDGYPPVMPDYRGQLAEHEIAALSAYLTCLAVPDCAAGPECAPLCADD
ncbi:MAG: c-type cytochrome [Kofleriaceae bacterium]